MIFDLRSPDTAGPLRFGAIGEDTWVLHTLATPRARPVHPAADALRVIRTG